MPPYYKVLRGGQSCSGGSLSWSLPDGDTPGGWHEVEGPLVQCKNGLHLTNDLGRFRAHGLSAYEAEFEGETIGPFWNELVCRKVRLLREVDLAAVHAEIDEANRARELKEEAERNEANRLAAEKRRAENREWRERKRAADDAKESEAYGLLTHVWRHTAHSSWDQLNGAMGAALRLAVVSGMGFHSDDFGRFMTDFNAGRWVGDSEWLYSLACGARREAHGGNPSAVQAYETWRGRKPFIVLRKATEPTKVRLSVGQEFEWHVGLKAKVEATVTSFIDRPPGDKPPYVVACSYRHVKKNESDRYKSKEVDKVFKITHEMIAEYHKAIRDHKKAQANQAKEAVAS